MDRYLPTYSSNEPEVSEKDREKARKARKEATK
jgi:hypothetical protein